MLILDIDIVFMSGKPDRVGGVLIGRSVKISQSGEGKSGSSKI
ncbi:9692_t:CDS:2 [Scutellospora calospora]|uniref:9692_t:CDS:1 n=1 Tax=Scutellospora calospora TaxID=85575 RepID=A0ACA9JUM0_9GLOM|nr:9692_t:CDS:2 [Scutellospora calospora]